MDCAIGKNQLKCEKVCVTCDNYKVSFNEKGLVSEHDREYVDDIICPYCGDQRSFEGEDPSGESECYECEKNFFIEIEHTVSIKTSADCSYNKEKHEWNEWEYFDHRPENDTYGRKHECTKCDENQYEFNVEKKKEIEG